jgi:simple sugar transport system ATP-binding protein
MSILETRDLVTAFGNIRAVNEVSLNLEKGEILGLIGDNGAGKSTFVKTIGGVYQPKSGEILVEGQPKKFPSPAYARRAHIELVYQDLALVKKLSVVDNFFLGRELVREYFKFIKIVDNARMKEVTRRQLEKVGSRIDCVKKAGELSGGEMQLLQVLRSLDSNPKILLLDEPAASLSVEYEKYITDILDTIRKERKISVILISHNLERVKETCDRIAIFRIGKVVATRDSEKISLEEMIDLMMKGSVA